MIDPASSGATTRQRRCRSTPGQDVQQDRVQFDVDTGEPGRLGVTADSHGAPAERGPVEEDPAEHRDHREDQDKYGTPRILLLANSL